VDIKSQWKGTMVFVAQPAEEVGAGAKKMMEDGLYSRGVPELHLQCAGRTHVGRGYV
jgi:metal-dependent amidase/aminoacylase/carboxypeptidase family protein